MLSLCALVALPGAGRVGVLIVDEFDLEFYDYEEELQASNPRDNKIDEAKLALMARFFTNDATAVYYGRQLEIALEKDYYHWITKKALNELVAEGKINFNEETLDYHKAHFYYPRRHRYPRRQISRTINLIAEFSEPTFTHAVGYQGESLADAGFACTGFWIRQRKVKEVDGKKWDQTNHDLDRLIERDGIRYGVEIKNQLAYIEQREFQIKIEMCRFFGIRPFFIARMMPKSYIYDVVQAGGFALILGEQHYPLTAVDLMRRVRDQLNLPVAIIRELPDTTLSRFEKWHIKQLAK